jgi:dUTP pyrophosphatase
MKIKLTLPNAKVPKRSHPTDAGADLFSPVNVIVEPMGHIFIDLGVQIELPQFTTGLIFARSGLGSKHGIRPRNCVGVIDEKYRDNLGIMLENNNTKAFEIKVGDRIAQLVIMPIIIPKMEVVKELDMINNRAGGFGSTGINN